MLSYIKILRALIIVCLLITWACTGSQTGRVNPGFEHFRIIIEQDGVPRDIMNNSVELAPGPFEIVIHLTAPDSIFANASFNEESFDAALKGAHLDSIKGFQGTGMAEELFNRDETLMISDTAPHYWHYSDRFDHRFSEVVKTDVYLICRKKISFYSIETDRKKPEGIESISAKTIYLVFMKLEWTKDFTGRIEHKRAALRLNFR